MLDEHAFNCPYCDAPITVLLDLSTDEQSYIEDCEVCCQPMQIYYQLEEAEIALFTAKRTDD